MSMCPRCRAISSIRCTTAQRKVVVRSSPRDGWSKEAAGVEHGVGRRRFGAIERDRIVDRPTVGKLEHVRRHVMSMGSPATIARNQSRSAYPSAPRSGRVSWRCRRLPAELRVVETFDLVHGALAKWWSQWRAIVISSAGMASSGPWDVEGWRGFAVRGRGAHGARFSVVSPRTWPRVRRRTRRRAGRTRPRSAESDHLPCNPAPTPRAST